MKVVTLNFDVSRENFPQGGSSTLCVSHKLNGRDEFTKFHPEHSLKLPGVVKAQNVFILPDDVPESCSLRFSFQCVKESRSRSVASYANCYFKLSRKDFSGEKLNFNVVAAYDGRHYSLTAARVQEVVVPDVKPSQRQFCALTAPGFEDLKANTTTARVREATPEGWQGVGDLLEDMRMDGELVVQQKGASRSAVEILTDWEQLADDIGAAANAVAGKATDQSTAAEIGRGTELNLDTWVVDEKEFKID